MLKVEADFKRKTKRRKFFRQASEPRHRRGERNDREERAAGATELMRIAEAAAIPFPL